MILEFCIDLLKTSQKRSGTTSFLKANEWLAKAKKALDYANKCNNMVFHDQIPDVRDEMKIKRSSVTSPMSVPDEFFPKEEKMFEKLGKL